MNSLLLSHPFIKLHSSSVSSLGNSKRATQTQRSHPVRFLIRECCTYSEFSEMVPTPYHCSRPIHACRLYQCITVCHDEWLACKLSNRVERAKDSFAHVPQFFYTCSLSLYDNIISIVGRVSSAINLGDDRKWTPHEAKMEHALMLPISEPLTLL